jgi:hypothetical protein
VNDAWGYTDETDQTNENLNSGPKPLRDALKAQKQANDDLMKRLAALEAQNARNAAADLIEAQGVARSAAKHYSGDADPEKVTAWVSDLRNAFGVATQQTQTTEPVLDASQMEQYQRMTQAGSAGTPAGNFEAAQQSINDAGSREELLAAFSKMRA